MPAIYRMSIIDQEIEKLWAVFQLARRELQPDASRLLLKVSLLYLHVRGLQNNIRLLNDKRREITPIDLDRETERTWSALKLGYKYGSPDLEGNLFKKSLQQIFFKGLYDQGPSKSG
jgi:hypothetical protein